MLYRRDACALSKLHRSDACALSKLYRRGVCALSKLHRRDICALSKLGYYSGQPALNTDRTIVFNREYMVSGMAIEIDPQPIRANCSSLLNACGLPFMYNIGSCLYREIIHRELRILCATVPRSRPLPSAVGYRKCKY